VLRYVILICEGVGPMIKEFNMFLVKLIFIAAPNKCFS
jgi:hypothetical protein